MTVTRNDMNFQISLDFEVFFIHTVILSGNNTDGKYFVSGNKLAYDSVFTAFRIPLWTEKTRSGQVLPITDVKITGVACGANHTVRLVNLI